MFSTLWIFYMFNILYADVLNLMGHAQVESSEELAAVLSPEMLLTGAFIIETSMVMIFLSRILKHSINRWANIGVSIFQALVLCGALFTGTPTIYYMFFVIVELVTLLYIIWYAWTWSQTVE